MTVLRLEWHGDRVQRGTLDATRRGMVSIMTSCVADARRRPAQGGTMPYDTGRLQDSLTYQEPERRPPTLVGYWGSFDVSYAIFQEAGTIYIAARRFLRNAAERWYRRLPSEIAKAARR